MDVCEFVDFLFCYDFFLIFCKINNVEICILEFDVYNGRKIFKVKCSSWVCEEVVNKSEKNFLIYGVYIIDFNEGFLELFREFEIVLELEI